MKPTLDEEISEIAAVAIGILYANRPGITGYERSTAELQIASSIRAGIEAWKRQEPVNYIDFQQQRGMMADAVDWAINEYDSYMVNDDYDAQAVLDQIISRLKKVRTITSLRTSETTGER